MKNETLLGILAGGIFALLVWILASNSIAERRRVSEPIVRKYEYHQEARDDHTWEEWDLSGLVPANCIYVDILCKNNTLRVQPVAGTSIVRFRVVGYLK